MLESLFIALFLAASLSIVAWGIFRLLTYGEFKKPWENNDWVTIGEYNKLSTKEKLEYHKYNGKVAEMLDLKYPINTLVEMKQRELYALYKFKKEEGKDFCLHRFDKTAIEHPELDFALSNGTTRLLGKLKSGNELEMVTNDYWTSSTMLYIDGENVGSIVGNDNVIQWNNLIYRDEVLKLLNKLDVNIEKALS